MGQLTGPGQLAGSLTTSTVLNLPQLFEHVAFVFETIQPVLQFDDVAPEVQVRLSLATLSCCSVSSFSARE